MKEALINHLQAWDGKHNDPLIALYQESVPEPSFFPTLVQLTQEREDLQVQTTWLIKHHYDQKQNLPELLLNPLFQYSSKLVHWGARLHVLQLLPNVNLDENIVPYIEEFVRANLKDENKFVRAWSYWGLYELTKYIPELKEEALFYCQQAMETESASVKSRARKAIQKLEKM